MDQSEVLDHGYLENKFERLDSEIGRGKKLDILVSDYFLESLLIGSGYLIEAGAQQGVHLHYEDKDIDLYVPDEGSFDRLCQLGNVYLSEVDEIAHANLNRNWRMGVPVEIFSGIPDEFGAEDSETVERLLESGSDDPLKVAYSGEHLEVLLPGPEVYAETKKPVNDQQKRIYREQLEMLDYLLDSDVPVESFPQV